MLDHLDDLASDFSVFHRIDDITTLDGPTFCRMAYRLTAYTGVMAARVAAAQQEAEPRSAPPPAASAACEINPGTRATLMADPAFAGIFSFG